MKQVKISDINPNGPIRSPLLPAGFIERVRKFKKILAEVETTTLEETILNFQKDQHPERELMIWEHIALNYQHFINDNNGLTPESKRDVLKVLLGLSSGVESFENVKGLNEQQVRGLSKGYLKGISDPD